MVGLEREIIRVGGETVDDQLGVGKRAGGLCGLGFKPWMKLRKYPK